MAGLQRVIALIMAAAMVFVFLVPLGMARHNYRLVAIIITIFAAYLAVNAWIFIRMRRRS